MSIWNNESIVREAVAEATSIAHLLRLLQLPHQGANYKAAYEWLATYNLQFTSVSTRKGKLQRISTCDILVENSTYTDNQRIKKRLLEEYGWKDVCSIVNCPNPQPLWCGKPLTMQLDHINGINNDNRIDNLRIICPNCHTQTKTYGSKNCARSDILNYCLCGKLIQKQSTSCVSCSNNIKNKKRIVWPDINIILQQLSIKSYTAYAEELNVTDNAIRNYLKRNNVVPPRKQGA